MSQPKRIAHADLKAHIKSVAAAPEQGPVQWPGEGSYQRRADYLKHGIALEATLAEQVDELTRDLGVPIRWKGETRHGSR